MSEKSWILPQDYSPKLNIRDTELAIKMAKDTFENMLANNLQLQRISAPMFVVSNTGLNDDLNGVERPVSFDVPDADKYIEVVHSLAKWKRLALKRYDFSAGEGLYTDMNAIRRDEELDNLHSIYVDQWDWEKVINREDRNIQTLQTVVKKIVSSLCQTQKKLHEKFNSLDCFLNEDVFFITSQELLDMYPDLDSKERENAICKEKGTVFVSQIGAALSNGERHDGRAPDYDDWQLNGDILIWYPVLDRAVEISSMGIRVDETSLKKQLEIANCNQRESFEFHKMLLNSELPLTIGGGIGQSRLCMLMLEKAHIGEVQVSIWPDKMLEACKNNNINIL